MSESASAFVLKNSEETVYSGYLVKGEERKHGTQVAFKDKKKYFVLRCLGNKLLTMTAYKDERDFRHLGRKGKVDENRFMESYNNRIKVHKLQMEVRKHKTADILCIVQDKRPLYLETSNRAEMESWYQAFNSILVQLGWKEPVVPPEDRPMSYPQSKDKPSTDQVNGDRYSSPGVVENAFEEEQHQCVGSRLSGVREGPATPPRSPFLNRNSNSMRSVPIAESTVHDGISGKRPSSFCCQRHHVHAVGGDSAASATYMNLHPVDDVGKWQRDVANRRERLVNVKDFYSEYVGPPPPADQVKQHRVSMERRRSKSTSDVDKDLNDFRHRLHLAPPEAGGSSEEEDLYSPSTVEGAQPPALPERKPTKPIPKQRRNGNARRPPDLSYPIAPPLPGQESHYQQPNSPAVPSVLVQEYRKSNPMSPQMQQFHSPRSPRKFSEPAPPHPMYVNMGETSLHPSNPSSPRQPPSLPRRPQNTSLDITKRPLPSPHDRPSSFVANLQWEQSLADGIPIAVPKQDLEDTLALVKVADYVWIAGKKRGCPDSIGSSFHVGDQLRQINDQIVVDVNIAHALFKTTAKDEVILMVKRLPYAKIVTVKRQSADIPWGLMIEGNKVLDVPKTGPAAEAGINARPEGAFSKRLCSWIITNINNNPVSLSCSRDEVLQRLDNTDLKMSMVLQPEDFITKLKAELQNVRFSIDYI